MKPRERQCKVCKTEFLPARMGQKVCGVECAYSLAKSEKARAEKKQIVEAKRTQRKADKAKREALKPLSQLAKDAEKQVNRYVRARDYRDGCISCDKPANWDGQWHASHFRSVGAASHLRFNLWNIHKACSVCNNFLSGNIAAYEPRLREKLGDKKVDYLLNANEVRKYERDYLIRVKKVFSEKAKRQEKRMGVSRG